LRFIQGFGVEVFQSFVNCRYPFVKDDGIARQGRATMNRTVVSRSTALKDGPTNAPFAGGTKFPALSSFDETADAHFPFG
jgi:hypothetical protein